MAQAHSDRQVASGSRNDFICCSWARPADRREISQEYVSSGSPSIDANHYRFTSTPRDNSVAKRRLHPRSIEFQRKRPSPQKRTRAEYLALRSELIPPQVATSSVKQCPLWAYLASQLLSNWRQSYSNRRTNPSRNAAETTHIQRGQEPTA